MDEKVRIGVISKRRMGAGRPSPASPLKPGELSAAEVVTTVRRLGFVLVKAFEIMQGNLIRHKSYELAERLNDTLKPLADMLAHFELETEEESDDEIP